MPELRSNFKQAPFDFAVVGAGVVGCAVARRLTLEGGRVIVLEKAPDILAGASKGNSALLHTGFDAPSGSIELECMKAGYAEYCAIRAELNLPLLETGAMVVAWTSEEEARLGDIASQAQGNGIAGVALLDASQVLAREPMLSREVRAALLIPGEHVIDPWSAPLAYLTQAAANGAVVRRSTEVVGGVFRDGAWALDTNNGPVAARRVVNCAGLYGDMLDSLMLGDAEFTIKPRKGQFVVFDKAASALLRTTILPAPTPITKGVVVARTIFGNVLVGPTAEEQQERDRAEISHDVLKMLLKRAAAIVPGLADIPVTAAYAGLRPATETKDYRIRYRPEWNWLTLGGIRSTGLTAALGLAQLAARTFKETGWRASPSSQLVGAVVPNLAEHLPRDWQTPGYGEIVCHCEMATHREIEAALSSAIPPNDLGGLKRRTRAAMGRCQGFYCSARLAEMTEGCFAHPLAAEAQNGR